MKCATTANAPHAQYGSVYVCITVLVLVLVLYGKNTHRAQRDLT